jgi:hypothetical protein
MAKGSVKGLYKVKKKKKKKKKKTNLHFFHREPDIPLKYNLHESISQHIEQHRKKCCVSFRLKTKKKKKK